MIILLYVFLYIAAGGLVLFVDTIYDDIWYTDHIDTVGDALAYFSVFVLLWPLLFFNILNSLMEKPFDKFLSRKFKGWWSELER